MDSDFVGDKLQAEASATASQRPHELTDYPEPREEVLTPNDNLVAAGLGRNASVCRQEHSIICANVSTNLAGSQDDVADCMIPLAKLPTSIIIPRISRAMSLPWERYYQEG